MGPSAGARRLVLDARDRCASAALDRSGPKPEGYDVRASTDTIIIGAGQAGLALSRCLTELDRPHLLLDRGRVGERWRSERWDSFHLLSPAWHTRLPGHRYDGPDPDAFLPRAEVVRLFDGYARSFAAPVREHTTVRRVAPTGSGWRVTADDAELHARQVVVATGPHDRPRIPSLARSVPRGVVQLHAAGYRNPAQLPPGGVLVVGAGPTGQQLASELARAGRDVVLAVGRHQRVPRTYRGRDAFWWLDRTGLSDQTVDELTTTGRPRPSHVVLTASRDLGLDVLVDEGVLPVGRLLGFDGTRAHLADDLPERYVDAERAVVRFTATVDEHVRRSGLDVPDAPPRPPLTVPIWALGGPASLDLAARGIRTVLWATGYRRDFGWLQAPVVDRDGELLHRRGVTPAPGLYALGMTWLYRRKSASIDGVGDDARYLADVIANRHRERPPAGRVEVGSGARRAG
jgi:putative flavoprotein involved in K+ transport